MLRQRVADLIGVGRVKLDERVLADIPEGNEFLAGIPVERKNSCAAAVERLDRAAKWAAQLW